MQIAVSYLRDRDDQCLTNGRYFLDVPKLDVTEFLAEAYEDVRTACRAVTGEECRTDPIVVKLLQERGVVPHLAEAQTVSNGWPEGLEQYQTFQLLCRLIEKADLAIAERRFNSS